MLLVRTQVTPQPQAVETRQQLDLSCQLMYSAPINAPGRNTLCITGTQCGVQQLLPLLCQPCSCLQWRQQTPGPCRIEAQEGCSREGYSRGSTHTCSGQARATPRVAAHGFISAGSS